MLVPLALLLAACCAASPAASPPSSPPPDQRTFEGRSRQLDVPIPRLDVDTKVDGVLDEPVWRQAARLTGFSRYAPTDGVAADDSTEVLVWYSPTAIHFGIRAYAEPGTVRATLADRDKIYSGDYVGIFLGTFNDGRQATVFAANPLGIQGDGIVVESGKSTSTGFGGLQGGREPTDISPDYVFQSKGHLTDFGYEVEIRIPFKSLRYQSLPKQTWGVNVIRVVQSRGYEYSWAPAQRAAASYLAQSGHLVGLTDLRRGLVLDLNPVVTARASGAPVPNGTNYDYSASNPKLGGNVRWGITNNVTLNGTIRPDFAEVESDAGQVAFDPRTTLFFAEKRPFFLDGIEQFNVPNQLIYTRRITSPLGAVKVAGKAAGFDFAALSAADDHVASATGNDRPLFNILRLQHDIGKGSRLGFVYTDREEPDRSNRVVGADSRLVWHKIYSAQLQAAASRTEAPNVPVRSGPLYMVDLRRNGRSFIARYLFNSLNDQFDAQSGFISRPAVSHVLVDHTVRVYGREGSLFQSASLDVSADGLWKYQKFVTGGDMLEKKLHFNSNYELRGGWKAGVSFLLETFGYDPDLYDGRLVVRSLAAGIDTVPFVGLPRITNRDYVFSLTTPNFRRVSANATYIIGRDENFFEWAPATIGYVSGGADWRPTDQLRVGGTYVWQWYRRPDDGTMVGQTRIPRVKVEYQISRAVFVRAVGEYRADYADDLRDAARAEGGTILIPTSKGYVPGRGYSTVAARAKSVNSFRPELLFSYLPSPGTVVFVGYGSTLSEPDALRFSQLQRVRDAVFVKLSYLIRRA